MIHNQTSRTPYTKEQIRNKKPPLDNNEWYSLRRHQKYACAICRKHFSDGNPSQTDHDHVTGLIRGLLCAYCNEVMLYNFERYNKYIERNKTMDEMSLDLICMSNYLQSPPAQEIGIFKVYKP